MSNDINIKEFIKNRLDNLDNARKKYNDFINNQNFKIEKKEDNTWNITFFDDNKNVLYENKCSILGTLDLNTNIWLKNIVGVGASYRLRQSVLALAEVQATPQLRVGYAYDMPFIRPNSHEFFLRYEFGRKFPKLNTYKID